jgi:hypothetical protein
MRSEANDYTGRSASVAAGNLAAPAGIQPSMRPDCRVVFDRSRAGQEVADVMTCRQFIEFLLEYIEERLSAEEQERFDAHLRICPDCRTYLETYGKTVELARLAESDSVPPDVPEDLIQAILRSRTRANGRQ